ncbi:head-tail connector protein [Marinobacter sp. JSM 1782161]|uniref:head-tail connector protein n=1 Tax=Marinobacter sp. JSM 1782161 TaxID=2685906 RepID=UPI001A9D26D2|nr:head-tail connector protein [Marinobacter sp. JSM 1782161]
MAMLVTLEQAKDHLKMDHDADDSDITLKIHAASGAVVSYLKSVADAYFDSSGAVITDSSGDPDVPFQVKAATLILTAEMYKNPEGLVEDPIGGAAQITYGYGYLPRSVVSLLYPLRDPACA